MQKKHNKTQKVKQTLTSAEKRELWKQFSDDEGDTPKTIECVDTRDNCYRCGSNMMIMEDGFPTCSNNQCSIIYNDALDYSPEWRFYGTDDRSGVDPARCGNPINPLLKESSFGCKVLCGHYASYDMKKIQKWTEWQAMPHKEKALYDEFQFINNMAQNSGIPKIFIDDAMIIHKNISEQRMFRGLNRDGIKSASIYIACRLHGSPRTAYEIAEIFFLDKASATNGCSMAISILNNIERGGVEIINKELCKTTPALFVERFCSRLHVPRELMVLAKFIAEKVEKEQLISDNTPHAVAAGIIFYISESCYLGIAKTMIKKITGISEVTVNKCFQKLKIHVDQGIHFIPKMIQQKYTPNL